MNATDSAATSPLYDVERVLFQMVEFAPNGVALVRADGRIMLINAELERMFGYTKNQLLGQPIEQLVPQRFRPCHVSLRGGDWGDGRPRALGNGHELFGQHADGSEFPIEIGLSALRTAERMWVVETIVDISARKRLERLFQRTVEAAPCALVMIDARGRIVLVNPQAELMFGYAPKELIGSPLELLLPERSVAAHGRYRAAFTAAPAIRQIGVDRDLTARRKDGTEFPVEIGLNPVQGEDGGLVLAAVTDITRRKSMELELREANANLEQFSYAASHDLKSPLRGIADLIEWITEDLGGSQTPAVAHNFRRVRDRIRRLEQLIDDLLIYSRASTTSAEVAPVEPRALIEGVLELQPPPPGFRISVRVAAEPFVTTKTPLEAVLRNLIGNAVKHHDRQGGNIDIHVEDAGRYCVFTVSDDGPGISRAAQERVFRMFQSLPPANTGSSGMGLALSKRFVECHGGRIALESTDGVRGASFRVWWPRFPWSKES